MATSKQDEGYSVEIKSVETMLHIPEPLMETLGRMAQYRRCSVEQLIIALLADNTTVQKFFTKAALALWEPS
jgi:predicted DNA-binding ribbon-helix-helix protein